MGDMLVFHSGVALNKDNCLVTNGGRVLITVSICRSLVQAAAKATKACHNLITFPGCHHRNDIAHKAIPRYFSPFTLYFFFKFKALLIYRYFYNFINICINIHNLNWIYMFCIADHHLRNVSNAFQIYIQIFKEQTYSFNIFYFVLKKFSNI